MSHPSYVSLADVITEMKPGFACGDEDPNGVFQIRMNNVTRMGSLDLSKKRRVPAGHKSTKTCTLRVNDVLFNATNSPDLVGKTALFPGLDEVVVFSNHFLRLRTDRDRLLPEYLTYWMQSEFLAGTFRSMCKQWVNQATVGRDSLLRMKIPLLSVGDQQQVVQVLNKVDALRAKRRDTINFLGQLTQSIFLDMFGDPSENPRAWPTTTLSGLVEADDRINYGVVQPGEEYYGGVALVRVGDLADGHVDRSKLKKIDPKIDAKHSRSRIMGNEILVGCVGSIGSIALVSQSDVGSNIARAVARIPISSEVLRTFIAEQLRSNSVQHYFTNELRTVAQPTLNIKQLSETIVMTPPHNLQAEFSSRIASINELRHRHLSHLAELDALFTSFQNRAFRGELRDDSSAA